MLMLTRKKNESFIIDLGGEVIKVTVTRIATGTRSGKREVQIGVEAPRSYKVWRTELFDAIAENKKAVTAADVRPKRLRDLLFSKRR